MTVIGSGPPPPPLLPRIPEDGEAVEAVAASADAENRAWATGGTAAEARFALPAGEGGAAEAIAATEVGVSPALAEAIAQGGVGGFGGDGGQPGGLGGAATASAVASNQSADPIVVVARAIGGGGGSCCIYPDQARSGDGGSAQLGEVYGHSTGGGGVSVFGEVRGGRGGFSEPNSPRTDGGVAASATLIDAVNGSTAGDLVLRQRAVGGTTGGNREGRSGAAESRLSRSVSATSLDLVSEAIAGDAPEAMPDPFEAAEYAVGSGAGAVAVGEGTNSTGAATVRVLAIGGNGGSQQKEVPARDGGSATARAVAVTHGDGNAVVVGGETPLDITHRSWFTGAWGGAGAERDTGTGRYGNGGDATSESIGVALGDSSVVVGDLAVGGAAAFFPFLSGIGGSIGGAATSSAEGSNGGSSPVEVSARAIGGFGTRAGGDASAFADASGGGLVHATARATTYRRGDLHASARGSGPSGSIEAYVQDVARASASLASNAAVDARLVFSSPPPGGSEEAAFDAFTHMVWTPASGDVATALADNEDVAEALAASEIDTILLMGRVGGTHQQVSTNGDLVTSLVHIHTGLPNHENVTIGGSTLAFFDSSFEEEGFGTLHVLVQFGGAIFDGGTHVLIDETFDDAQSAQSFLAGLVLDPTGACADDCESGLDMRFEFTSTAQGAHFATGWLLGVQTVPEPSTALLVAMGLLALAARTGTRR